VLLVVVVFVSAACSGSDDGGDSARAPTTIERRAEPIRMVTLNVSNGVFCAPETDSCHAPDRAEMTARAVDAADCPELVGFQEIGPRQPDAVPMAMARVCQGRYELAWEGANSPDRAMVFTTLPILDRGFLDLAASPWEAYWVRVDAPLGPIDFLTAHFAFRANNPPCDESLCPPVCAAGLPANECHAIEVVAALDANRAGAVVQVVSGDLNARPGSPTLATFERAGYVDAWLASGEPECDAATGRGCTGARERPANALDGLDVPDGRYTERIDFVLARPGSECTMNATAAPFVAEPLATPFRGLYWPSDHAGVLAELTCD
jgi:hypothetical protein